jgi:hypothetical protein
VNLQYAVERLYQTGWSTFGEWEIDRLPDGRAFPSLAAVQREFARVGLKLSVKHNLIFNCHRATWAPSGEPLDDKRAADESHGTVIDTCDREAAVYALAQLREAQGAGRMALA